MNTRLKIREVPTVLGIDECEYLYSASIEENGQVDSVYVRVDECQPGEFFAAVTIDSESGHFCQDLTSLEGPYKSPDEACQALSSYLYELGDNGNLDIELCSSAKKALNIEETKS